MSDCYNIEKMMEILRVISDYDALWPGHGV